MDMGLSKKIPFELTLIVTHGCNLNCVYCYEHNKRNDIRMNLETAKAVINKFMERDDYDEIRIGFIGGEPLLEFNLIKKICEWFWSKQWNKKFLFFATTNGTVMTDSMKEWFTQNRTRFWLTLSIDGTKETHDRNRCNSFDKIDINFFLKNWPAQPIKMTISEYNIDSLAKDVKFLHSLGFKLNGCNFAEGVELSNFIEKYKCIAYQYEELIKYYLEHPEYESPFFQLPFSECETRSRINQKRCGTGEHMAVADCDGTIYPCTYFSPITLEKSELTRIMKIDFNNHQNFINEQCLNECYIYPICHGCYGDNFTLTGNLSDRSVQKCALSKLRIAAACKYMVLYLHKKLSNYSEISEKDALNIVALKKISSMFNLNV